MKLFIDDANIEAIKRLCDLYPIDGVTTNPSILSKQNRNPEEVLKEIREIIGEDGILFAQAIPTDAEGMVKDAEAIVRVLGKNTVVKIPCIPEGFKAIRILKQKGIPTCGTPYVNRIDNMGYDGIYVTKQIHDILVNNHMDCGVLAASFKNSQQVLELCEYGVYSSTCAPDVIDGFVKNLAIYGAVNDFISDFNKLGQDKTMKDYFE